MKKKLKTSGNGFELYFPKALLQILGYNPVKDKFLITSKNSALYIRPIAESELQKYENNMVRGMQKSGGSYAIYFPQALIEILEINPNEDFIDVLIDENVVVIKKG